MNRLIILASSSQTRKILMDRLHIPYESIAPDIDETPHGEIHADTLAMRLASEKALVIAKQHPEAIIIGSDQVAWYTNEPHTFIGKPKDKDDAIKQLEQHSGKTLCFSTGLSVQCLATKQNCTVVAHYEVKFRELSRVEIERYIEKDQPFHCAGSFKCESLGISLFESMTGRDQTALMGLPLIQLTQILREFNLQIP